MTAEIAIINKYAAVLAADSAITVGARRVFKSSNKIFSLGPHHDVVIMIHGSGDFCGVPWETIIKMFREHAADTNYATLSDLQSDFFDFTGNSRFQASGQNYVFILGAILDEFEVIKSDISSEKALEFRKEFKSIVRDRTKESSKRDVCIADFDISEILPDVNNHIKDLGEDFFEQKMTKGMISEFLNLMNTHFSRKDILSGYETGLVFAGYGDSDIFPLVDHYTVDGRFKEQVRYWHESHGDLESDNAQCRVMTFAQTDIARLFMEGITNFYLTFIEVAVRSILDEKSKELIKNYVADEDEQIVEEKIQSSDNEKITTDFMEKFATVRRETTTEKIMQVISSSPKEDLADLAEALVELTSARRRLDSDLETVAGPIDVAIITKGDGVIWHKRKNYFDLSQNLDYQNRKRASARGDHEAQE